MNTLLKSYIHCIELNPFMRYQISLSDPTKIRMYDDPMRPGVRLRGTWNKNAKKIDFPLDEDLTVRLPLWEPQAVKAWDGFEELSSKPDSTEIGWRVSDDTNDYWYSGAAWVVATLDIHWNTEIEVSANIATFPHTQKKIQFVARLLTTDRWETPILYGFKILMQASFDWFEDLIIRSLVPRLRNDFSVLMDWSGVMETGAASFNIKTDFAFTPEEDLNVISIEAVYNDDTDPDYETDLLDNFNPTTGEVTLTGAVPDDTRLFYRLQLEPVVSVNFTNVDYVEVSKTPAVIIESIDIRARQVKAIADIALKDREEGRKLDSPLRVEEMRFYCSFITGKTVTAARLLTNSYAFVVKGTTQANHKPGPILKTKALDLEHTLKIVPGTKYNPKPNISDLKEGRFTLIITDFYVWLRDIETKSYVKRLNYSVSDMKDSGPGKFKAQKPPPGGKILALGITEYNEEA